MAKKVTITYKKEGKVKICKRCPGEHELHGIVDEFQLRKLSEHRDSHVMRLK